MVGNLDQMLQAYASQKAEMDRQGIYFVRDINDDEAEKFSKSLYVMGSERSGYPGRDIDVYINSGGGSVGAGFAMIEMMFKIKRDFKVRINTIVTGYAYSMGAILFQAGDWRKMGFFSTLMLHSGFWQISGEDQKVFKDYEKLSVMYQNFIGDLFAKRTKRHDLKWWRNYIYSGRDRFLSAREALDLGLVDEVCDFDSCYVNPSKPPMEATDDKKTKIAKPNQTPK